MARIGFVGVGLMGHGMARNLLEKGHDLTVTGHRNRGPVEDLVGRGAREAGDFAALARASDFVFLCLPGSPQVEQAVRAMIAHLPAGAVVIDCSTSNPVSSAILAAELEAAGLAFADAPLGGTPKQAEEGALHAMVGAHAETFARIEPLIACWAAKIVHIGAPGDGHRMKLLNNFLSLGYAAIYSEALTLAQKVGLSPQRFDSVIRGSRMDCGFYQTFMGYLLEGNREAHKFTLVNALKDMTYLEAMADAAQIANPVGNAVKNSFATAVNRGASGPQDYVPMLPQHLASANGVDLRPKAK
jgi:3-hydroxyisobutyrate dehydrogenase-like beta-hydroxyacid dehydrogenase